MTMPVDDIGSGSVSGQGSGPVCSPNPGPGPSPRTQQKPEPEPARQSEPKQEEETLPPLTPQEFRIYNRLAETMEYFHDHFRQTWTLLYEACARNQRPPHLSLRQFLDEGLSLVRYLTTHHTIEETHLYPILARKMPEFRAATARSHSHSHHHHHHNGPISGQQSAGEGDDGNDCELIVQHRLIHAGMDEFEAYLRRCKTGECELSLSVLKEKMDSWGEVLLRHLDQEVEALSAERMRRYWTVSEMRAIPI